MKSACPNRLTDILDGLQARLEGCLRGSRAAVAHPGARGEVSEDDWLRVLPDHLRHRYRADRAFVIDSLGECSKQIDMVIYDRQYSPLLYNHTNQRYVPAESVFGVVEVKQDLSREHVIYAGRKAASVRRLHRTSAPIPHMDGIAAPRPLPRIIVGMVTYQSYWVPSFGDPFREVLNGLAVHHQLDVGCALLHGTFEARYPATGGAAVNAVEGARSLAVFLMRLLSQLQALGTAPAIVYAEYLVRFGRANGASQS